MTNKRPTRFKLFLYAVCVFMFVIGTIPMTAFTQPVSAEGDEAPKCDEAFYSSNDVLFYNPCETSCSANPAGSGAGTISTLRGANNAEKIFNFWLDAGMTSQQAAGITGSIQHESGFSPFRQEMSQSWPNGGWGIAQFTFDPGQRGSATAYVRTAIGDALFNEYYKPDYGGAVSESNGFIPTGVPQDVNDKFLLGELNYLLDHIKALQPNNVRRDAYQRDFNQTVDASTTLYDYLKSVEQASDAATAWTYLYEYPGDIKNTATGRAETAANILTMYGNGVASSCGGGLTAGGMQLDEAIAFMEVYKTDPTSDQYLGGAGRGCPGGPLANCVSFSTYFINKYTNLEGFTNLAPGNGSGVAANIISRNPTIQSGTSPRPYAIFSVASGVTMCGDVKCGHTGVVLGVDTDRGKIIIGEAGCGASFSWTTAHEYELADFDNGTYTYAYTDGLLKGDIK